MPWLNRVDVEWLRQCVKYIHNIYILEDHAATGGLGDFLLKTMVHESLLEQRRFRTFGVEEMPAWGTPAETLQHHGLDGSTIAAKIKNYSEK